MPKPTFAMVRGYCIFGGWMIASAMDLVFASPDTRFLAGLVEYFSIPWDIHPRKARELVFESRFIDAEEARGLGFVNRIYPTADLERETLAYARRVAENGRTALRVSKLAINKAQDIQGCSAAMESTFADYLVMAQAGGATPRKGERHLGAVDLALRGLRGERPGLERGQLMAVRGPCPLSRGTLDIPMRRGEGAPALASAPPATRRDYAAGRALTR